MRAMWEKVHRIEGDRRWKLMGTNARTRQRKKEREKSYVWRCDIAGYRRGVVVCDAAYRFEGS